MPEYFRKFVMTKKNFCDIMLSSCRHGSNNASVACQQNNCYGKRSESRFLIIRKRDMPYNCKLVKITIRHHL